MTLRECRCGKRSVHLGLALLLMAGAGAAPVIWASNQAPALWFDDLGAPLPLSPDDERALLDHARGAIAGPIASPGPLGGVLTTDQQPRIVFLSVSDGRSRALVSLGAAAGIAEAIRAAGEGLRARFQPGFQPLWFKLDVVQEVTPPQALDLARPLRWERSLYGLAFDRAMGLAFLPEEIVAATLINSEQRIQTGKIAAYAGKRELADPDAAGRRQVRAFKTHSLFGSGGDVVRLFRGHRLFPDVSADEALAAARRAGAYLIASIDEKGRFAYAYRPKTATESEDYNVLRHAGTVFAMLELYEATANQELLGSAARALDHLMTFVQAAPDDPEAACVVERGFTKLGGNALAVVALAKYQELTGDGRYQASILKLGRRIRGQLDAGGRFLGHKVSHPQGQDTEFVSDYYPGQAILALVKTHHIEGGELWLEAAGRAAGYLIERDRGVPLDKLNHDHWLLYALDELHRVRPDPSYVEHTLRLVAAISMQQRRTDDPPDWVGSYLTPPRSTPTAVRSEGLCAAYRLLSRAGRSDEAATCLEGVRLGLLFQLQTQFGPESAMYLPDPARALGGFRESLTDYEIRIDYVQHNISALLAFHRIVRGGSGPPLQLPALPPPALQPPAAAAQFPVLIKQHLASRMWPDRPYESRLTRPILLESLRLGRRFLLNHQKPAGNFNYEYDFVKKTFNPDDNSVRQAGTAWSLALLYQFEQDPETRTALDRALRFFFEHSQPGPVEGSQIIAYPGESECTTGTVALVSLTIIDYLRAVQQGTATLNEAWRAELTARLSAYLEFLKFMRQESGHFSRDFNLRSRSRSDRISPYADGEALLCWTKAARYLDHVQLRPLIEESALAMARRYTLDAWRREPDSDDTKGFFQWGCMAFWEYQDAGWSQSDVLGDCVVSLGWWMIHTHGTLSRPRNTAYAYEGIIPAWRIARARGDQAAVNDLARTIDEALYKLTSWQVGGPLADQNPFLVAQSTKDPLAIGGVMNHGREAPLRIDVTQHQMHALMLALRHVYTE